MTSPAAAPPAALLCLDLQPVFLGTLARGPALRARCAFALAAAHGLGLPVVFTEQVPDKLGPTAAEFVALIPVPRVFAKTAFSALGAPAVAAHLAATGARRLLIAGLETPICVLQSALDALAAGYEVTILADAVGARREDDAAAALAHLARTGAAVLPAESVFYSLLRDANHPFFRSYTALVRKYG